MIINTILLYFLFQMLNWQMQYLDSANFEVLF